MYDDIVTAYPRGIIHLLGAPQLMVQHYATLTSKGWIKSE
jgi:hypothetical protein